MKRMMKYLGLAAFLSVSVAGAALGLAQTSGPTLLETLERGLWQFRAVGGGPTGASVDRLCVDDLKKLAQIQHNRMKCTQKVLRSNAATVQIFYSCPGEGQGLTTIRKESNRLIHIDSQGVRNNSPFSFTVEARRSGSCNR